MESVGMLDRPHHSQRSVPNTIPCSFQKPPAAPSSLHRFNLQRKRHILDTLGGDFVFHLTPNDQRYIVPPHSNGTAGIFHRLTPCRISHPIRCLLVGEHFAKLCLISHAVKCEEAASEGVRDMYHFNRGKLRRGAAQA